MTVPGKSKLHMQMQFMFLFSKFIGSACTLSITGAPAAGARIGKSATSMWTESFKFGAISGTSKILWKLQR